MTPMNLSIVVLRCSFASVPFRSELERELARMGFCRMSWDRTLPAPMGVDRLKDRRGIGRSEVKEEPKAGDTNEAQCHVGLRHAVSGKVDTSASDLAPHTILGFDKGLAKRHGIGDACDGRV